MIYDCRRGGQNLDMNTVTVYDIQNKFIAYSAPYPDVIGVVSEWGSLYILSGDSKVITHKRITCRKSNIFQTEHSGENIIKIGLEIRKLLIT